MKRGQSAIDYFIDRVRALHKGDPAIEGTSGMWSVKVERVMVPMLQATATHPAKPAVRFRAGDAKDLAWKLIGVQINMKPFQWDSFPENDRPSP